MNCPKCGYPDSSMSKGTYSPNATCDGCRFVETNNKILDLYESIQKNIEIRSMLEKCLDNEVRKNSEKELSKEHILTLIKIAEIGDNSKDDWRSKESLVHRLLGGKCLIDRWGNITTKMLFNTQHKKSVSEQLLEFAKKQTGNDYYDSRYLWGAEILFSDAIPLDKILFLSNEDRMSEVLNPIMNTNDDLFDSQIDNGRAVAVVPMVEI